MLTIFTRLKIRSGNRGREDNKQPGTSPEGQEDIPRQSSKEFVPPASHIVKRSPSIKEHISDSPLPSSNSGKDNTIEPTPAEEAPLEPEAIEEKTAQAEKEEIDPVTGQEEEKREERVVEESQIAETADKEVGEEPVDLAGVWTTMLETSFKDIPTVYYSLKEYLPEIKGSTLHIRIKNGLQKEQVEIYAQQITTHIQQYFDQGISDFKIVVDDSLESTVKIMSRKERVQELCNINQTLPELLQRLDLAVKD